MNNLFLESFPFVETDEELEKVKQRHPQYGEDYIATACIKERRQWIEKLWIAYESYADNNFISDIITGGNLKFNERTWELYLASVLLQRGFILNKKPDEGPDFLTNLHEKNIWIEATAPGVGEVDPAPEKPVLKPGIIYSEVRGVESSIRTLALRFAGAIRNKSGKEESSQYFKGCSKNIILPNDCYIIAINGFSFCGLIHDPDFLVRRTLFAAGCLSYPRMPDNSLGHPSYLHEPYVEKQTPSGIIKVPTDIFTNKSYEEVSAIIYSPHHIIESPKDFETIGNDLILVRNPFAKNPLPKDFPIIGREWVLEGTKIYSINPNQAK